MELLVRYLAVFALLATTQLASCQQSQTCVFDAAKDLNDTVIYLEAKAPRFRYPNATGQISVDTKNNGLRIACPSGTIVLNDDRPANLALGNIECVGGNVVKLSGVYLYSPLNMFGCSVNSVPTVQLSASKTSEDKTFLEIGYKIDLNNFVTVIDEVSANSYRGGYTPRWVHFKVNPAKTGTNSGTNAPLKKSPLSAKISFETVYDAVKQRAKLATIFKNSNIVDKYMPADGSGAFVPSTLISKDDLYYKKQQDAAGFYETTVPVWKAVDTGNWKRVSEVARQMASQSTFEKVDIWSGVYLQLWLPNEQNKTTYVSLPEGIKPSQFLFKVVYDEVANRGMVFVTVNNPHLTQADERNVICKENTICKTFYPEFANFAAGYTYCCNLGDFKVQAEKLGLPVFKDNVQAAF